MNEQDSPMAPQLEDRLKSHFHEVASGINPDGAGADAAMAIGRRMGTRRRAVSSIAAVALVVVGIGGAFSLRSVLATDPGDIVALDPTDSSGGVGAGLVPVSGAAASLDWYAVDGTVGFSSSLFAASDGTLYALSTAPGVTWENAGPVLPKAIYHSEDGETWEVALLDGNQWVTQLAERGGTLYAMGTAPGVSALEAPPEFLVGTSKDGGATWETTTLPTRAESPPQLGQVTWVDVNSKLAAGPAGVVALASTRFNVDLFSLLPDELRGGNLDVQATADGIQAIDYALYEQLDIQCSEEMGAAGIEYTGDNLDELPESCQQLFTGVVPEGAVVFSAGWDELGFVDGNPLYFSEFFVSSDGVTFEKADSPFGETEQVSRIFAHDKGFVALSWGMPQLTVRTSTDGRLWEIASGLPAMSDVMAAGSYGGSTVLVGMSFDGKPVVAWSDGAGGWQASDLTDVVIGAGGWLSAASVGEQGVVFAYQSWDEPTQRSSIEVVRGTGQDQWESVPVNEVIGASDGYIEWLVVGRDVITGRVVMSNQFGPATPVQLVGAVEQ